MPSARVNASSATCSFTSSSSTFLDASLWRCLASATGASVCFRRALASYRWRCARSDASRASSALASSAASAARSGGGGAGAEALCGQNAGPFGSRVTCALDQGANARSGVVFVFGKVVDAEPNRR